MIMIYELQKHSLIYHIVSLILEDTMKQRNAPLKHLNYMTGYIAEVKKRQSTGDYITRTSVNVES